MNNNSFDSIIYIMRIKFVPVPMIQLAELARIQICMRKMAKLFEKLLHVYFEFYWRKKNHMRSTS